MHVENYKAKPSYVTAIIQLFTCGFISLANYEMTRAHNQINTDVSERQWPVGCRTELHIIYTTLPSSCTLPYWFGWFTYTPPYLFDCFTYTTLPSPCPHFPTCLTASHTQLCLPHAHTSLLVWLLHIHNSAFPMPTLPYLFDCFTYTTLPSPCPHFPTCLTASHTQLCLPHAHTSLPVWLLHIHNSAFPMHTLPYLFDCFTYTTLPSPCPHFPTCLTASRTQLCLPHAHTSLLVWLLHVHNSAFPMPTLPYLFDCFTYTTLPSPCPHFPTCLTASHTQLCLPHAHTSLLVWLLHIHNSAFLLHTSLFVWLLHIHNSAFPMHTLPYLFDCFTYTTLPSPCTHFPTCLADSHTQLLPSPCPHFPTGLAASHTQLCLPHAHTSLLVWLLHIHNSAFPMHTLPPLAWNRARLRALV